MPGAEVETLELDLESFDSVRGFVKRFRETGLPLHVLVNNAGERSFHVCLDYVSVGAGLTTEWSAIRSAHSFTWNVTRAKRHPFL